LLVLVSHFVALPFNLSQMRVGYGILSQLPFSPSVDEAIVVQALGVLGKAFVRGKRFDLVALLAGLGGG